MLDEHSTFFLHTHLLLNQYPAGRQFDWSSALFWMFVYMFLCILCLLTHKSVWEYIFYLNFIIWYTVANACLLLLYNRDYLELVHREPCHSFYLLGLNSLIYEMYCNSFNCFSINECLCFWLLKFHWFY